MKRTEIMVDIRAETIAMEQCAVRLDCLDHVNPARAPAAKVSAQQEREAMRKSIDRLHAFLAVLERSCQ